MSQSRRHSVYEAIASTVAGFCVSVLATHYVLPLWGFVPSWTDASTMTLFFTGLSLVRIYVVRRLFEAVRR